MMAVFKLWAFKLESFEFPVIANPNFWSLRASAHTGVAIPRLEVLLFVDEFQKTVQKNGLYDDG